MQPRLKAHLAVLSANLFFGINFSVMKHVTGSMMSPLALNVLRVVGSALLFWIFILVTRIPVCIKKEHRGRLIICALTGIVINQVLFTKGVSLTTPIHGALLMLVCPIAVVFIAAIMIGEGIHLTKLIGLVLGICGAAMLILLREATPGSPDILTGDLLIMANALSYAFYMVLVMPLMKEYNGAAILTWMFTFACLVLTPIGWNDCGHINWASFSWKDWAALLFVIIAVTFLAYVMNIYSIRHLGPSVTGAYIYTQPLFAGIISVLFAGDTHHMLVKLCAALLIMTGVYLVSRKKNTVPVTDVSE